MKIYVAGHKGMVGRAICKVLINNGYNNLVFKNRNDLDLTNSFEVKKFFEIEKPNVVINAAAKVGGILANSIYPYEFLLENMQTQNNLIQYSLENNIEKFIFLGSSCVYPKLAKQPLKEEYLLSGYLEETNYAYAIAKISGIKLCEAIRKQFNKNYFSIMPCNLYGHNDNFDLKSSHVLPAMIRKFHDSKIHNKDLNLWGSGTPLREFLYVEDLAESIVFLMNNKTNDFMYNIGSGKEISIKNLALLVKKIIGYDGNITWDQTKPDGTPRKVMDSSKINNLGWQPKTSLESGIDLTYKWFLQNFSHN
jgi:GDP-L-fucose synthase